MTAIADTAAALSFDGGVCDGDTGGIIMADKPLRPDRAELLSRGMAIVALLAAVVWAWIDGGAIPPAG